MPLINVVRKPETLKALQLTSEDQMWEVWKFAKARGYMAHVNADSTGTVTLGLTSPQGNTSESARLNDWALVTNDTIVQLVPAAQATSLYAPAT